MSSVLDRRALNRATLARQLLLERSDRSAYDAIEHLAGLQAQTPHTWYVGLWSRLDAFQAGEVSTLLLDRKIVRMANMRSTIHLVSDRDAAALRSLTQTVSERGYQSNWAKFVPGLDTPAVLAAGREILEREPMTFADLGRALGERFPGFHEAAMAQTVRTYLPLVQVTPRGVWGRSGAAKHTTLDTWIDPAVARPLSIDDLFVRYLSAYGPASVRDWQTWSGLTRLSEVAQRMRPDLVAFTDEHGVELFDLPGAPRPDPATPAPVRLLYDYDNLFLSHSDRSRVITDAVAAQKFDPHGFVPRLILIDGFTAGHWTIDSTSKKAVVTIHPFGRLREPDISALEDEGMALAEFLVPKAEVKDVEFRRD